jgi:hypothetical protein
MSFLFDTTEAAAKYAAEFERTRQKTKAEILVEIVREDATYTVAELSEASGRSSHWVRKTLRQAGITLARSTPGPSPRKQVPEPTVQDHPAPITTGFFYQARTEAQWQARAEQGKQHGRKRRK